MTITGRLFIGSARVSTPETFRAKNPATGEVLPGDFCVAGAEDIERACTLADAAFAAFSLTDRQARAAFLDAIADAILALGDGLIERAHAECGLPPARLTGERGRTVGQLRLYAAEVRDGAWQGLRIDPAMPGRQPLPRSDIRMRRAAVGPVAVFGASNFPLAFSVAGGDTASALAAGCPVIVKGHPAHPGTSELIASAIVAAVAATGMPEGVFSMLNGPSNAIGAQLVADPRLAAVGFTGSRAGGLALTRIAAARAVPIPVYAEMSAVNPVILLPGVLEAAAERLAAEYVGSLSLGVGQFCTNPGVVFAQDGPAFDRFLRAAAAALAAVEPGTMLTSAIHDAYDQGLARLGAHPGVSAIAQGPTSERSNRGRAALFMATAQDLARSPSIAEEVFGPSSIVVRFRSVADLQAAIAGLESQLTATVHFADSDHDAVAELLPLLERKAGRLIANGWPTGVEVCHAMVHGGPFPATSDGRSTSVGTLAIDRFLRPVAYQDFPDDLLPPALRDGAQTGMVHRFDGKWRV